MDTQPPSDQTPPRTPPAPPAEVAVGRASRHAPTEQPAGRAGGTGNPIGAILVIVGALAILAGVWLPWIAVQLQPEALGKIDDDLRGVPRTGGITALNDGWAGQAAIACGIALIVVGVIAMLAPRTRRAMGVLALLTGIGVIGLAGYAAVSASERADERVAASYDDQVAKIDVPAELQATIDETREALLNAYTVGPGIGLWLAIGGGVVGIVGGALCLRRQHATPTETEPATAPDGGGITA